MKQSFKFFAFMALCALTSCRPEVSSNIDLPKGHRVVSATSDPAIPGFSVSTVVDTTIAPRTIYVWYYGNHGSLSSVEKSFIIVNEN
jgi:hypothetical protein